MQRVFIILLAALAAACGHAADNRADNRAAYKATETEAVSPGTQADGVEVLSFHAKRRCATCVAIEKLTREVVAESFAPQVADGKLRLRVIDISEDEATAERYEVTWSSLLLCRRDGSREQVNDLTRFAFAKARTAPDEFKQRLKDEIEEMLTDSESKE